MFLDGGVLAEIHTGVLNGLGLSIRTAKVAFHIISLSFALCRLAAPLHGHTLNSNARPAM